MKLGTTLHFDKLLGFEKSAEKAAQAGFRYIDFDLTGKYDCLQEEEERYFAEKRAVIKSLGMKISQAHAPFVRGIKLDDTQFLSKVFMDKVRTAIRRAAILECPYLVFHPFAKYPQNYQNVPNTYFDLAPECIETNLKFLRAIESDLERYGVKLALENLNMHDFPSRKCAPSACCTSQECNFYIDELGSENFCICLDVGHLNLLSGERHSEFIHRLGKRIEVLHLHDNFGALNDPWFGELDRHLMPFVGCVPWKEVADSLKEIGFNGVYSFECASYGDEVFADTNYRHMYLAGKKIFG